MAKLYLIRHGESLANTQGIYQGQTYDTKLSPLGVRQAVALARKLRYEPVRQIIASPLTRTRQTAQVIGRYHIAPVDIQSEIIETNHGEWEGRSVDEIRRRWPGVYHTWTAAPSRVRFPKGETYSGLKKRVWRWWEDVGLNVTGTAVVVTHDNVIRILLAGILEMPVDNIWLFQLQPTGITIIETTGKQASVMVINDTGHLRGKKANLAKHAL